jgi:hypothetical protein
MQNANPGRKPDWNEERIMRMDRAALELGKRCIMWDDKGTGFFLVRKIIITHLSTPNFPFRHIL